MARILASGYRAQDQAIRQRARRRIPLHSLGHSNVLAAHTAADEVVAPAVAMSRVCVVTDTGADVDKRVAEAWARVEAGLSRVLTASLRQLNAPAAVQAIDAVEAALAVPLPQDFRASLRIHNGTDLGPTLPSPDPSPVPLKIGRAHV